MSPGHTGRARCSSWAESSTRRTRGACSSAKSLFDKLRAFGHDHTEFELHGSEISRGGKQWDKVDRANRRRILDGARRGQSLVG